jgi:hypothetical protein
MYDYKKELTVTNESLEVSTQKLLDFMRSDEFKALSPVKQGLLMVALSDSKSLLVALKNLTCQITEQ